MTDIVSETYQARFPALGFSAPNDGVLEIELSNPATLNSADADMHGDLARVWDAVSADRAVRCVLVRGAGRHFSAGGDFGLIEDMIDSDETLYRVWHEARDLVYGLVRCDTPVVAAINGAAVGAGLAVALLSDISIAGRSAKILDGHVKLGVAAGDHSAIVWPLLCGMAKAKYHLLTNTPVDGAEAERIGLVSRCVEDAAVYDEALAVAQKLAEGSVPAISWTKYALNSWLRMAGPAFDTSLALEFWGFRQPDIREGLAAAREKRKPDFRFARPPTGPEDDA